MKSFRTEIENPIVEKDIIELEKKFISIREVNSMKNVFEVYAWHGAFTVNDSLAFR
tara:strand:+ start:46 stop:213 length:168 start_codon:yes stop_codon:yes gene_type:complete